MVSLSENWNWLPVIHAGPVRISAGLTMTVKLLVALKCGFTKSYGLLLVTMVVMVLVVFFCASVGVQVMMPLALMLTPEGG